MGLKFDVPVGREPVSALDRPEDVFLSWLMALPQTADHALAAEVEILRLGKYAGQHPGPARLLSLFKAFHASLETACGPRGTQ